MELTNSYRRVAIKEDIYDEAMSKFSDTLPLDNLFGQNVTRLVIPFEDDMKLKISKVVGRMGYDFIDWSTGEVLKTIVPNEEAPPGTLAKVQRTKLGRVLERLPGKKDLLNWWSANREIAQKDEYSIVISRHPVDVVRMSDHEDISSCHSPNDTEWASCMSEMKHGGLVAYLVNTEDLEKVSPQQISGWREIFYDHDRDIEGIEPLSRLRLRRYTHKDGDFDLAIPEKKMYGGHSANFKEQVMNWARKSQETLISNKRWRMNEFIRRGGEYHETSDSDLFNAFFDDNLEAYGSTQFGVEGEEDVNRNEQLREEIEAIHQRWKREFEHCDTNYEEMGPYRDGSMFFSWDGSMVVRLPENIVTAEARDELDDEDVLNQGDSSLRGYLSKRYFYLDENGVSFSSYTSPLTFIFSISDRENNGTPSEYDDFCASVSADWDKGYHVIKAVIMKWLLDRGFSPPTPVRQFQHSNIQFQSFEVEIGDGKMTASADGVIGKYEPDLLVQEHFKSQVDTAIRQMVSRELTKIIYSRKHPTGHLPGFEPEQPVTIKEDYNLSNFGLFIKRKGSNRDMITLEIEFSADDLTSEEDMQEVIELMQVVDRIFPRIIAEGTRLLNDYYTRMREQGRRNEMMRGQVESSYLNV